MSSESYILLDPGASQFQLFDLFNFIDGAPIIGRAAERDYGGGIHLTDRYVKDTFTVQFPKLTASQWYQLNVLLRRTGTNALHTLWYSGYGPNNVTQVRKYDGSTAYSSGYNVNDDVQRLRNKVYATEINITHWPQVSNVYSGTVRFEEG